MFNRYLFFLLIIFTPKRGTPKTAVIFTDTGVDRYVMTVVGTYGRTIIIRVQFFEFK